MTTDTLMVRRAQQGDTAAFEDLVRRYESVAFRTAWLILGDTDDARDATQSGFLKAWVAISDVEPARPFQPWLMTIVANEARNRRRARRRWLARVLPEDRIEVLAAQDPSLEQDVALRDDAATVLAHLRVMDEADRMTIWCRYVLDLGEQETADVMGCAVGTMKSRTHRAMERLRARLRDAGVWEGGEQRG